MTYQQPPPGQYPQAPPPPPPRRSNAVLWVVLGAIGGLILLCGGCLGLVAVTMKDTAINNAPGSSAPAAEDDTAPAGTPVRDGRFEFLVTGVDRDVPSVGDNPYLAKTAQGVYVLVHVNITNIATGPQSYLGNNQKLIDDQGREFTNDTGAEVNLNAPDLLFTEINPGNTISVLIAFDLPPGTVPTAIEFHDSMFSEGTRVALP
ncbi:DUF4352 domain-containing protein [Nocardia sp. NPDC127526]|uniref:DUF4352 domain-containing protein n=1 Tax=Nocardia sp. NPDC127526 TaxID=3345393 RepID=UPI0036299E82